MEISEYSELSFVVRGEGTKLYIEEFKQMFGRYNPHLEGGPGWIFSKKRREEVEKMIASTKEQKFKITFLPSK